MSFLKRRILSFVLTVNLLFLFLGGKLFYISASPQTASTQSSIRVKDIASTRGMIYDRNLQPLVNETYSYTSCVKPTLNTLAALKEKGADAETLKKISEGYFLFLPTDNENYYGNTEDIKTLTIYERYSSNLALHILGYTDSANEGVCGIEKYYNDELNESGGTLSVAYSADANGRMLTGEDVEIRDEGYYNNDGIALTLDKRFQEIAETALKNGNIDKGAVVVLDIKTSEILACASTPVYDRDNLGDFINSADSPFINRAFSAYPVGSVFKVVTAAAAIENGVTLPEHNCVGYIEKSGNLFNCNKLEGHGKLNLSSAMAVSCNPYFIELGTKIGAKELLHTAENAGFGKQNDLGNGFYTDSGILPDIADLNSDAAVGNFAFGQGKLTATPLQIASLFATIANGGTYNEPSLIKGDVDENGAVSPDIKTKGFTVFKESTCNNLKKSLLKTTSEGTGATAFSSLFRACTKTATAQSGQYDENGNEIKYCWFAGFFPYNNPQYAICILKENGVSGGSDCGPVFKEISENIYITAKE